MTPPTQVGAARVVVDIDVPGMPIGANQVHGAHWSKLSKPRREWQSAAMLAWIEAGRPTFTGSVAIEITSVFGTANRRDESNYAGSGSAKFIIDALVGCGCIPDDAAGSVRLAGSRILVVPGDWRVIVSIRQDGTT
jgi:hypothetical protein